MSRFMLTRQEKSQNPPKLKTKTKAKTQNMNGFTNLPQTEEEKAAQAYHKKTENIISG